MKIMKEMAGTNVWRAFLSSAWLLAGSVAFAAVEYRVVAESGESPFPPGTSEYETFIDFALFPQSPAINSAGEVVFWARLGGGGITSGVDSDHLIFVAPGGEPVLIARQGGVIPDGIAPTYGEFQRPLINEAGQVAFKSAIENTLGAFDEMVFRWTLAGGTERFFEKGNSDVSGFIGVTLGTSAISLLADGNVAVSSELLGNRGGGWVR